MLAASAYFDALEAWVDSANVWRLILAPKALNQRRRMLCRSDGRRYGLCYEFSSPCPFLQCRPVRRAFFSINPDEVILALITSSCMCGAALAFAGIIRLVHQQFPFAFSGSHQID